MPYKIFDTRKFLLFALLLLAALTGCKASDPQDESGTADSSGTDGTGDDNSSSTTFEGRCDKGHLGCECDEGKCHDLTVCNPETFMCECIGAEGCACTNGGGCDPNPAGLVCDPQSWTCAYRPGEEGADCHKHNDCNAPFLCETDTRSCECSEGRTGCDCTDAGNCDDETATCDQEVWTCKCTMDEGCVCGEGGICGLGLKCNQETLTCECMMAEGCLCEVGGICDGGLTCVEGHCKPLQ